MTVWEREKEFDSFDKLLRYLGRIEVLKKAEIKRIGYDRWILFFNQDVF